MLINIRNLMVSSIFTILEYFTHFGGTLGVKRDTKWGNPAHLLTISYKDLQIWSDMIIDIRNLMVSSIFTILEYFIHFGAPWGSKGAQNRVTLPISSQLVIRTYEYGQI